MTSKLFHKEKYYVTFKRGFEDSKKDLSIEIVKIFENDTLKITLSDDNDPTFLYMLTLTRLDYEDLKKCQGLLVDFDNFPSQLVRLLQQCASNNMFLNLQQTTPLMFYLEVVEHNEFKRLVHLSLKTGPATDVDIKQHMADNIINLKKTLAALNTTAKSTENVLSDKCLSMERKIHELSLALTRMEEEKLKCEAEFREAITLEKDRHMQEKQLWQRNAESNLKSHTATHQENLNKKEKQFEEMNSFTKQLRENIKQLENQLSEKSQCLSMLEKEVQKSHIEVATLTAKNSSLEKDIIDKDRQYSQLNSRCTYLDKNVKENADIIKDLNSSLQIVKKEKLSLEERLAFSESLVKKNNEAVHSTSEQLLKANQIISKQNADLIEMKEKLLCRTAIAIEQEKVIEQNAKDMDQLTSQFDAANQKLDKLQKEFEELQGKYDAAEKALKDKDETIKNNNMVIQWLHKKMECSPPSELASSRQRHIQSATSSTPYFLAGKNDHADSINGVSDESIDFYATTKSSNLEESPGPQDSGKKIGVDPKYLKPADIGSQVKSSRTTLPKSGDSTVRGKENMNVNLPKVDYREKKSARGTYRTTPVSAYFPR